MLLTYLMLAVALGLSAVAAYYSIVGLTAIFAAAVIPIVIMGGALEIAKLVVTVWLHEYWGRCRPLMKFYLVPAVGVLMLITSMGIFGFLSKAHMDQTVPAGDVAAKVAIFDEKIKTQKDNIEASRRALAQMDAAVDQILARSDSEQGAARSAQLRRSQAAERTRLQNDIAQAQKVITQLNEERTPIASELRKVEAEVGPIKYIAALIYGSESDTATLENAVRWVIIILVFVFDPLAIFMLLASTESYKWDKENLARKRREESQKLQEQQLKDAELREAQARADEAESHARAVEEANKPKEEPVVEETVVPVQQEVVVAPALVQPAPNANIVIKGANGTIIDPARFPWLVPTLQPDPVVEEPPKEEIPAPEFATGEYVGLGPNSDWPFPPVREEVIEQEEPAKLSDYGLDDAYNQRNIDAYDDYHYIPKSRTVPAEPVVEEPVHTEIPAIKPATDQGGEQTAQEEQQEEELVSTPAEVAPTTAAEPVELETVVGQPIGGPLYEDINTIIAETTAAVESESEEHEIAAHESDDDDTSIIKQAKSLWKLDNPGKTLKDQRRLLAMGRIDRLPWEDYIHDTRIVHDVSFGRTIPEEGIKGDLFVDISQYPTKLYKHNGSAWMPIDKETTDSYTYNQAYIDYLIGKLTSGEYELDLLTDAERAQIEIKLQQEIS